MKARATLGVNTPKSGNPNHSFHDNGRRKHTKIVRLPSLRFRAIGRTTDTIRSTPQSIGQRQKHSTSDISNLWENRGLFHIIASTKDRSILADTGEKSLVTSSLQNSLANSKTWQLINNVSNGRLFFRYSYSTLKLYIMRRGRHPLVGDHRRQEWHSRKASSCHTPFQ